MAGAYCQYCNHRCFVYRVLPDRSWAGHMTTCAAGMAHDRKMTGHDHTTAINPLAQEKVGSISAIPAIADALAAVELQRIATEGNPMATEFPIGQALAYRIADDAIGLFLEYRDQHSRDEADARREAASQVAEGASVDIPTEEG